MGKKVTCPTIGQSPIVVVPLRSEEVPEAFVCAVCLTVPIDPWVVKECHHVFCKSCIEQCFECQRSCPVCRRYCSAGMAPMRTESPLGHRIWSGIGVKCQHHSEGCGWTGSLSDYKAHTAVCLGRKSRTLKTNLATVRTESLIQKYRKTVGTLLSSIKRKDKHCRLLEQESQELQRKLDSRLLEFTTLKESVEAMRKELDQTKKIVDNTLEIPLTNRRGEYTYDRSSIVKLTKLICQNLEQKPPTVDSDKIFDCILRIGRDESLNEWTDCPGFLYVDLRMLLCVCLASTWFTSDQLAQIREMAHEHEVVHKSEGDAS